MTAYLLPCPCGTDIVVTVANAGGVATCPGCGAESAVPKFRDLSGLAPAKVAGRQAASARPGRWTAAHTMLLAGSLVAAACGLGSVALVPPEVKIMDSRTIRDAVMAAPTDEVFTVLRTRLASFGIERPPTADEAKSAARSDFYVSLRDGLRAVAGIGALVALCGGALILLRGGQPVAEGQA